MREIGVHELLRAPLADVRERRERDREVVERDRERLSVELSRADDLLRVGEHDRIVRDRVELALEHGLHVRERLLVRAVDLRDAAQRIRILHTVAVLVAR